MEAVQETPAVLSHEMLESQLYDQVYENIKVGLRQIITHPDQLEKIARDNLNPARAHEQLKMLERCIGSSIQGFRTLEVGCGPAVSVALARVEFGAESYGIEPGDAEFVGAFDVGRQVMRLSRQPEDAVRPAVGEAIPFPDGFFDAVYSSNVLEHVQDPQQVINESLRILKPGGYLHIVVPNYGSWWEGHYGILWFPRMTLWMAKTYLRLLGRDPGFLDTLQFIDYPWLKRLLAPHQEHITVLGWGQDVWEERVHTIGFSEWANLGTLKQAVELVHRLGLVKLVLAVGKRLHWETPIILTVRKTS